MALALALALAIIEFIAESLQCIGSTIKVKS